MTGPFFFFPSCIAYNQVLEKKAGRVRIRTTKSTGYDEESKPALTSPGKGTSSSCVHSLLLCWEVFYIRERYSSAAEGTGNRDPAGYDRRGEAVRGPDV